MHERFPRPSPSWKACAAVAWLLVLALGSAHAQTGSASSVGYIDSAIPQNLFRFRYDHAYDDTAPYRAEFLYGKPGELGGPSNLVSQEKASYQDLSTYTEVAVTDNLSGFVELPVRFLQTRPNGSATGLGDMNAGFKYAFLQDADDVATFQLRTYLPTGAASRDLGNDHVSLEPGLLYLHRFSEELTFEAELKDWIPVGGTDFAGNILRYGVGLSYLAYESEKCRVTPVLEIVGWSVLSGKDFNSDTDVISDAAGTTIVNAKVGLRVGLGEKDESGTSPIDLYVGYGRVLTDQAWYENLIRAELRYRF
jgi:hypothetical protein